MIAIGPNEDVATHTEITPEQSEQALVALSEGEYALLHKNADQFRHYINKKAKRLKREAKLKKVSITSEGATQS